MKKTPSAKPIVTRPSAKAAASPRAAAGRRTTSADSGVYVPPVTISRGDYLRDGRDLAFRDGLYAMVMALDGLLRCRDIFGKALELTGSQFAVLIGTAYRQGAEGVMIRELSEHVRLAAPHVTTEVSRLIKMGLLIKRPHKIDRRGVLVSLSPSGEAAVERITPLVQGVNDILFEGISHHEFQTVTRVMRSLTMNVEKVLAARSGGSLLGVGNKT